MNLILFDEPAIRQNLLPFTFTRPVADIRVGILTIAEKWAHFTQQPVSFLLLPPKKGCANASINAARNSIRKVSNSLYRTCDCFCERSCMFFRKRVCGNNTVLYRRRLNRCISTGIASDSPAIRNKGYKKLTVSKISANR